MYMDLLLFPFPLYTFPRQFLATAVVIAQNPQSNCFKLFSSPSPFGFSSFSSALQSAPPAPRPLQLSHWFSLARSQQPHGIFFILLYRYIDYIYTCNFIRIPRENTLKRFFFFSQKTTATQRRARSLAKTRDSRKKNRPQKNNQ